MALDFSKITSITIPEGVVSKITMASTVLWQAFMEWYGYPLICNGSKLANFDELKFYGNSTQNGGLPDGYTRLEYVETSGGQYIDTGIVTNSLTAPRIVTKFESTYIADKDYFGTATNSANTIIFDCSDSAWYGRWGSTSTMGLTYKNGKTYATIIPELGVIKSYDFRTVDKRLNLYVDGVLTAVGNTDSSFDSEENIFIGKGRNRALAKWYSFAIYDDDTLLRNFVPAKRDSDSVVGMFDFVTNTFFTNVETGAFVSGPETPTPVAPIDIESVGEYTGLPYGYTELDYIESTGTQYIDTGISDSYGVKVEGDILWTKVAGSRAFVNGAEDDAPYKRNYPFGTYNGKWHLGSYSYVNDVVANADQKYHIEGSSVVGNAYLKVDGETILTINNSLELTSKNLYLFNSNGYNQICSMRIYGHFKYYSHEGVLIRNFVPTKRNSDDTIGMYDTVNNVFYENAGTGTFVYGEEITQGGYKLPIACNPYDVPNNYTVLNYIESTGTQYINTGVIPTINTGFKTNIIFTGWKTPIDDFIIGVRSTDVNNGRFAVTVTDDRYYASMGQATVATYRYVSSSPSEENLYFELNYKNSGIVINQNISATLVTKDNFVNTENLQMYIAGAYNLKGTASFKSMRQFKTEITENDEIIRCFIPVKRNSDSVVGMFDTVTQTFYENAGTGDFIGGEELTTTTNIYIKEPLRKIGTYADIIDINGITATVTRNVGKITVDADTKYGNYGNFWNGYSYATSSLNITPATQLVYSDYFNSTSSLPETALRKNKVFINAGKKYLGFGCNDNLFPVASAGTPTSEEFAQFQTWLSTVGGVNVYYQNSVATTETYSLENSISGFNGYTKVTVNTEIEPLDSYGLQK